MSKPGETRLLGFLTTTGASALPFCLATVGWLLFGLDAESAGRFVLVCALAEEVLIALENYRSGGRGRASVDRHAWTAARNLLAWGAFRSLGAGAPWFPAPSSVFGVVGWIFAIEVGSLAIGLAFNFVVAIRVSIDPVSAMPAFRVAREEARLDERGRREYESKKRRPWLEPLFALNDLLLLDFSLCAMGVPGHAVLFALRQPFRDFRDAAFMASLTFLLEFCFPASKAGLLAKYASTLCEIALLFVFGPLQEDGAGGPDAKKGGSLARRAARRARSSARPPDRREGVD